PQVLHNIEEVDKALAGRRLPEDVMVVRGSGTGHLAFEHPEDLVGQRIIDKGYMSTSLGVNPAGGFSSMDSVMHLRVPEGTPALWLEKVSNFGAGERELLLGRGMTYQVTRAFRDEHGKLQIYGEILPST
ncbi:ADP-ribosyltransferase, partial [Streptomyces sp. NPDC005180]|uniref:ADP-ribosyltransferase n=2 Tax=unclassified Streptomyces TaxID=2593676 RepID=UPI0033B107C2